MERRLTMETMFPELQQRIWRQLTTNDLLSCRLVSRAWNRRVCDLFGHLRFTVWIDRRRIGDQGLVNALRRLARDLAASRKGLLAAAEEAPTLGQFALGRRLAFSDVSKLEPDWDAAFQELEGHQNGGLLASVMSAVQELQVDGGFLSYRQLVLLLSRTPALRRLRLAVGFDRSPAAWTLPTGPGNSFTPNSLEWLGRLDISDCTGGLNDRTLLALTGRAPILVELNAGRIRSMVFYPGVLRRFYTFKSNVDGDEGNNQGEAERDREAALQMVLRRPTSYGLTFAAVRAMLEFHTVGLSTIRLAAGRITVDSVRQLLKVPSLRHIHLEGVAEDAEVARQLQELQRQAVEDGERATIHLDF